MKAAWSRFSAWWGKQPPRARALLLIALPAVLLGATDALVWSGAQREAARLRARIAAVEREAANLEQARAARRAANAEDAARAEKARDELARLDAALREASARSVPPAQTSERLAELMRSTGGATAVGLASGTPQPVAGGDLYRHPFTLSLEGDYASLLQAIRRIEQDLDSLQWSGVEFQAAEPLVRGRFEVFTLSGQNVWIRL